MVYSSYKRQRILHHYCGGHHAPTIAKLPREEGLKVTRVGIAKFLMKFQETGSIGRRLGSGRPSKITAEMKETVEKQMRLDDETTTYQLHQLLTSKGYSISLRTILRCRTALGWTFRGSAYCQLIQHPNKLKRLEWANNNPYSDEAFKNVIFTDECTLQLETQCQFCCRKRKEPPKLKPR